MMEFIGLIQLLYRFQLPWATLDLNGFLIIH